ncbi:SymE family type I addiction module toxin [Gilliamella sp. B2824]|nr:SymE family type I addiction module toxin [Gilliamella sp. B2824]
MPSVTCHKAQSPTSDHNWLNELGFTTGQPVTITAKKGKLIVQHAN